MHFRPALVPLSHHHHQALVMGRSVRLAAGAAPVEQALAARAYLEFFDGQATAHFRDEEERFFPLLLGERADAPPELARALVEHTRLRALARELRASLARGELSSSMLEETGELLESHVRLEERVLFPMLKERAAAVLADGLARAREPSGARHEPRSVVVDLAQRVRGRGPQWGLQSTELNATLLAWPAGAGFAEHRNTERDVLLIVLEGSATLTLDGVEHETGPHELMLLPRGAARALSAGPDGVRYLSIHLRRDPLLPRSRTL